MFFYFNASLRFFLFFNIPKNNCTTIINGIICNRNVPKAPISLSSNRTNLSVYYFTHIYSSYIEFIHDFSFLERAKI